MQGNAETATQLFDTQWITQLEIQRISMGFPLDFLVGKPKNTCSVSIVSHHKVVSSSTRNYHIRAVQVESGT